LSEFKTAINLKYLKGLVNIFLKKDSERHGTFGAESELKKNVKNLTCPQEKIQ